MITANGPWFKDEFGRTLILRGINLAGSSKVPTRPDGVTHNRTGFFDHRNVSFIGRPFPLEEADEHFSRLRSWGFTFLRFLVTWEAIEHAGPGIYDQEYLDYLEQVVKKADEYGINLFIDPHQDVWSRFSGGDGAPGWTFEAVGMDITKFNETGAAIVHATHTDAYPGMIWITNYAKFATSTLFTLFFAGNVLASQTCVDGVPVQEFLQQHYIRAIKQVALKLKGMRNVVGYGTMNEPSNGYIGHNINGCNAVLFKGDTPTIWQSMLLASGFPQEIDTYKVGITGMRKAGRHLKNTDRVSLWLPGEDCVWKKNGVWQIGDDGNPNLLRPDHFQKVNGHRVNFYQDFFKPFATRFVREIRSVDTDSVIFLEGIPPTLDNTRFEWESKDGGNIAHAVHWYDGLTLVLNSFSPFFSMDTNTRRLVFGFKQVQQLFVDQLAKLKYQTSESMNNCPTLIGEFGVPFAMNNKAAFKTGDYKHPAEALDMYYRAMEANLLYCTLWNYTPDNTHSQGDQWNTEDLSLFSREEVKQSGDINTGGRALGAAIRPYARATAGEPLSMSFNMKRRIFTFEFRHDNQAVAPTEIFVPNFQYPAGYRVEVSDGSYQIDTENQLMVYHHDLGKTTHRIKIIQASQ